ncbi:MAG: DUF1801 domain-containing protein [Chloroflexi bacterium]|nr:DUF1801 domain-containing protein [Chloroflexota bacterium]
MEQPSPEVFLAEFPGPLREIADGLRGVVARAVPAATERVRWGWRIIGFDLPVGPRRSVYFAWIMIEPAHVHLGFPQGVLMADPGGLMSGAGITKKARWVTLATAQQPAAAALAGLVREAARIATLSRGERAALAMAHEEIERSAP